MDEGVVDLAIPNNRLFFEAYFLEITSALFALTAFDPFVTASLLFLLACLALENKEFLRLEGAFAIVWSTQFDFLDLDVFTEAHPVDGDAAVDAVYKAVEEHELPFFLREFPLVFRDELSLIRIFEDAERVMADGIGRIGLMWRKALKLRRCSLVNLDFVISGLEFLVQA